MTYSTFLMKSEDVGHGANTISASGKALRLLMSASISISESICEICKENGLQDSQEFMDWQDKLNAISVMYG